MKLTAADTSYNTAALVLAITYKHYITPEAAFQLLEVNNIHKVTDQDKEDMLKLREQGLSYSKIAQLYGLTDSNVYKKLRDYMAKKETLQGGNLSKVNG